MVAPVQKLQKTDRFLLQYVFCEVFVILCIQMRRSLIQVPHKYYWDKSENYVFGFTLLSHQTDVVFALFVLNWLCYIFAERYGWAAKQKATTFLGGVVLVRQNSQRKCFPWHQLNVHWCNKSLDFNVWGGEQKREKQTVGLPQRAARQRD